MVYFTTMVYFVGVHRADADTLWGAIGSSRHSPAATSKAPADPWDFDTFASSSADAGSSSAKSSATRSQPAPARCREPVPDLFDFDQLDDGSSSFVSGAASGGNDTTDDADDDILGALSKPVSSLQIDSSSSDVRRAARGSSASSAHSSRVPSPASGSRPSGAAGRKPKTSATRSFSPPPHIIGQIVEMGFSPQEARAALAETETGLDVQAALDALLGQAGAEGGDGHDDGFGRGMEEDDRQIALELQRQEEAERAYAARAEAQAAEEREAERRRRRRTGPSRESTGAASPPSEGRLAGRQRPEGGRPGAAEGAAAAGGDWQEHADRLYAQATELGTNVFSRANAFWSSAKAQAQKALEERNARAAAAAAEGRADASSPAEGAKSRRWGVGAGAARNKEWEGKPKWMQDAEAAAAAEEAGAGGAGTGGAAEGAGAGGFKDSDDEGGGEGAISLPVAEGRERRRVRPQESSPAAETLPEEQDSSVLGGDADIWDSPAEPVGAPKPTAAAPPVPSRRPATEERPAYASPARRAAGGRSSAPKPARAAAAPPAPLRERNLVPEDTAATSSSAEHKAAGNASFKQGAYGDAEAAYTRAIDVLPDASLRRVPLFNNRANARLKNGDSAAALKDCDAVLALIVPASSEEPTPRYYPQQEAPLPASLTDAGVNLRDAWAKALLRRAQAKEALERWAPARKDWEALMAFEKEEGSGRLGVQNLRAAQDGNARCGKMLGDASKPGPARSTGASRSAKAAAASAAARAEEAAVQRVRADTAAANAEDAARLSLKDAIDARVAAWKAGKDTNVRALVASLDSVVWPELGWKKVGMHELITDAQVKKGYTRAIARLHPDKVSPARGVI